MRQIGSQPIGITSRLNQPIGTEDCGVHYIYPEIFLKRIEHIRKRKEQPYRVCEKKIKIRIQMI